MLLRTGFALLASGALLLVGLGERATAHHSFAMYDDSTEVTLTGKLTRFVPGGNHAQLYFELVNPDGTPVMENDEPVQWGVETAPSRTLASAGITVNSLPPGTIITVTMSPLRDGRNFGALRPGSGELISCGTTMPEGGCTAETGTAYEGLHLGQTLER